MIAFIADVHDGNHRKFGGAAIAGINRRCQLALNSLMAAVDEAKRRGASALVVLGDLFDVASPSPQIVYEVADALDYFEGAVYVLKGNHDMVSDVETDHALGPLALLPEVRVISRPVAMPVGDGTELVLVPFAPAEAIDVLRGAPTPISGDSDDSVLCFHAGIRDGTEPPWLRHASDSVHLDELGEFMRERGHAAAIAGNWHDAKGWRLGQPRARPIVQAGALVPTGFDNPGLDAVGRLWFWDGQRFDRAVVPGPRFLKAGADDLEEVLSKAMGASQYGGMTIFVSARVPPAKLAWAERLIADTPQVEGEVLVEREEVDRAVRRAAEAAASAAGADEALAAFVAQMPLAAGVDRAAVESLARGYLGGAA